MAIRSVSSTNRHCLYHIVFIVLPNVGMHHYCAEVDFSLFQSGKAKQSKTRWKLRRRMKISSKQIVGSTLGRGVYIACLKSVNSKKKITYDNLRGQQRF